MPSTYTLNNGIELIGTGEQSGTWGDTTNTNLQLLDTALDGQVTVALSSAGSSGSPNNLPVSDGTTSNGRNRLVIFSDSSDLGATAYVQLTPNDSEKIIYVRNSLSGSRSIALFQGTYNASNDYEVPAGTTAVVFFNGAGTGAVAANVFNNAFFDSLRLGGVSVTAILDEDDMSSDSATALATQQSIKKYVDDKAAAQDTLAEVLANGNTTGGTDIVVSVDDVISLDNGTNLLPSLTTTGDLNTGLYFPAADEVGLTVGGTQRLNVSATGVDVTGALEVTTTALVTGVLTTTAVPLFNGGIDLPTVNTFIKGGGHNVLQVDATKTYLYGGTGGVQFRTADNASALIDISNAGILSTATAGTSNLRLGVNAGSSIVYGGNQNVVVGDEAGTALTNGDANVALGYKALYTEDTGNFSTAIGYSALRDQNGNANNYNTAVGYNTGLLLSTGSINTFVGALSASGGVVTGTHNVAVGSETLYRLTSGASNVALGFQAMSFVASGNNNVAIGREALESNTTSNNTAVGYQAAFTNNGGANHTALGYQALYTNSANSNSTAVGYQSLYYSTAGTNTALGYASGQGVSSGTNVTTVGRQTLTGTYSGDAATVLGAAALYKATTAANVVAIGVGSQFENLSGSRNVGVGDDTIRANQSGVENTAVGYRALISNLGDYNTAIGGRDDTDYAVMNNSQSGTKNVAVGNAALSRNSSGVESTAVGYQALRLSDSNYNTAIGAKAGVTNSSGHITAVGSYTLYANTTGTRNVAVGGADGSGASMGGNQTGNDNVAMGYHSLQTNVSGALNVALGSYSFYNNVTNSNVGIGFQSGYTTSSGAQNTFAGTYAGYANTTASGNTYLGNQAGYSSLGSYNTFLGHDTGRYMTSGNYNTVVGRFNGNQHNLDLRTSSNVIVLSDGEGKPGFVSIPYDGVQTGGRYSVQDQIYTGPATGWDSTASINTWTTITAVDFNDGVFDIDGVVTVIVFTNSLNASYGYYARSQTEFAGTASNTGYIGTTSSYTTNGSVVGELQVVNRCHTQASALDFRMRIANVSGVGSRLQVYSNVVASGSAGAPSMVIAVNKTQSF